MSYVLVLLVYAGIFSQSDSVALTNVPGFKSEAACVAAGAKAAQLTKGTKKDSSFVCIPQP